MKTKATRLIPSMKKKTANATKRKSRVSFQNRRKKTLAVNEAIDIAPSKKASNIYSLSQISPYRSIAIAMAAVNKRIR
jgi:hypothetical protein